MATGTVFVSGGYDLVHGGHVEFFERARALGERLVVCIPSDRVMRVHKGRVTLPADHKAKVIGGLTCVDEVVVGDDEPVHLNFVTHFRRIRPDKLVVTLDDRWLAEKRALCEEVGAQYTAIGRSPTWPESSTSEMLRRIRMPSVPARVDLAGGWLDVPRLSRPDSYIVNCAITPFAHPEGPYRPGTGVGGSAAYAVFQGKNAIEDELQRGVGWQDPAVILETGLCVWQSGPKPQLLLKTPGTLLAGRMLLVDTGCVHSTPDLTFRSRDYERLAEASRKAAMAVSSSRIDLLAEAVNETYHVQLDEGMVSLEDVEPAIGKKYCGAGYGGYALYLFASPEHRELAARGLPAISRPTIFVEPYLRPYQ